MRSAVRVFLQLVLALTLLLSVGARAEGGADPGDTAVFKIDNCVPGSQYTIFVIKQDAGIGSLSGDSLYYIDQLKANASEMLVAVVLPGAAACDAYAGGVFADDSASPRKLGSFTAARVPGLLEEIGVSAFEGSAFTHVILGEKVKAIGSRAFADCEALVYVYLPPSVESIEPDAFVIGDGEDARNNPNLVIGCRSPSYAEAFAAEYGIPCETVD